MQSFIRKRVRLLKSKRNEQFRQCNAHYQVIRGHGNPPKRQALFTEILITGWLPMNCKSLKKLSKPQNKHHKNVLKNVTHCFTFSRKEVFIHWLTTADVFSDVFGLFICDLERLICVVRRRCCNAKNTFLFKCQ